MSHSVVDIFRLIKFSHTLFALPFALASFLLATQEHFFSWQVFLWVLLAMVSMRSAAMCFNRWLDADVDAQNPRTSEREIPQGVVSKNIVALYVFIFSLLFFLSAYMINELTFRLSLVAWVVCLGYSFCKRFTSLSHFVLGLALAISPIGAWIAVTGHFDAVPLLMGLVVLLWTAGFDILYACMDYDFDRRAGLHSIPAFLGIPKALKLARGLHFAMVVAWLVMIWVGQYRWPLIVALGATALILILEHRLVKTDNLKRMNLVFFKLNVLISFFMLAGCGLEVWL